MVYREDKPAPTDPLSDFPSTLTANAIAFREAIEKHSFWTVSSGLSAGIPHLSDGSFGPGACRAFFDVASNMSTTLAATKPLAGRLYVTSDTSRLVGYMSSAATTLLGSKNAVVYRPSGATITAGARWLVQIGSASASSATGTVTFTSQYSGTPVVYVSPIASAESRIVNGQVTSITSSAFSLRVLDIFPGVTASRNVMWLSVGTVLL